MARDLQSLRELEDNWNGYGEKKPADLAFAALERIEYVPLPDGGIQAELHHKGVYIEIEVGPTGDIEGVCWGPER